jgi:hypothetical protein
MLGRLTKVCDLFPFHTRQVRLGSDPGSVATVEVTAVPLALGPLLPPQLRLHGCAVLPEAADGVPEAQKLLVIP